MTLLYLINIQIRLPAERARAVIDARTQRITMLLVDDIELIKEMTDKNKSGDRDAARLIFDIGSKMDDGTVYFSIERTASLSTAAPSTQPPTKITSSVGR